MKFLLVFFLGYGKNGHWIDLLATAVTTPKKSLDSTVLGAMWGLMPGFIAYKKSQSEATTNCVCIWKITKTTNIPIPIQAISRVIEVEDMVPTKKNVYWFVGERDGH